MSLLFLYLRRDIIGPGIIDWILCILDLLLCLYSISHWNPTDLALHCILASLARAVY